MQSGAVPRVPGRSRGGQRLLEQAPLLGIHGLGLGAELPALQTREFEVDLLDLGLAQRDLAVLVLQLLALLDERGWLAGRLRRCRDRSDERDTSHPRR
jgi:hypothetical protein